MSIAVAIVASGRIVATLRPLLRRIVSTFIGVSQAGAAAGAAECVKPRAKRRTLPSALWVPPEPSGGARLFHRLLLDAVIRVEPDQVLDLLPQPDEAGLIDAGVAAARHDLGKRRLDAVHRRAEHQLRIDAAAIAHVFQFAQRQD